MAVNIALADPPYEVVIIQGVTTDTEGTFFSNEQTASLSTIGDYICRNRAAFRTAIGLPAVDTSAFGVVGDVLGNFAGVDAGSSSTGTPEQQAAMDGFENFCEARNKEFSYQVIYSKCSMLMMEESALMRLVIPIDGSDARMQFGGMGERTVDFDMDYALQEYDGPGSINPDTGYGTEWPDVKDNDHTHFYDCEENNNPLSDVRGTCKIWGPYWVEYDWLLDPVFSGETVAGVEAIPMGKLFDDVEVKPKNGRREYLGVSTRQYDFKVEGSIAPGYMKGFEDSGVAMTAGQVHSISEGTAWIRRDAPGAKIVAEFYRNFANKIIPDDQAGTLLGGTVNHLAKLTQNGLPLHLEQESAVRIVGMPGVGKKSKSVTTVTAVGSLVSNAEWCAVDDMPTDDWHVMTWDEYLNQGNENASANQGSSMGGMQMSAEDQAAMAEGRQEMEQAIQSMSPEDRAMLESMGMDGMLDGVMGGVNQGGSATAAAAESPGSSGSKVRACDDLQGANLTESVQKHLQALDYDVGEVNGEQTLETTIAISTFQAEKGLAVTGEVTPQLLGILSAELDSRC